MKAAAVSISKKATFVANIEEPQITTPHGVKLRILRVGVCGTDREIVSFDYGTPPAGFDFLVLGHETIGEVVEVGSAVTGFRKGDLAVPSVRRPCDHPDCAACRAGRQDFCYTGDYTERGIKERHGYMTELVVDEEQYMSKLPSELHELGVLTEPLTIAEKSLEQVRDVQKRLPWTGFEHRAVVLGAGPVGLLGAMALKNEGFDVTVYSAEQAPNERSELVSAFGGKYLSSKDVPVDKMAEQVGRIDLVYEAVGASAFAFDVLRVLGINGIFVFTGVPGHHPPTSVNTDLIMRNMVLGNQSIIGSVNAGKQAFEDAIRDLTTFQQKWPGVLDKLITKRYPLDNFTEPVNVHQGIKNVIQVAD